MSEHIEAVVTDGEELSELLQVRHDKLNALIEEGNNPFEQTVYERTAYAKQILEDFEAFEDKTVRLAGRIMSHRDMGKASFMDLADSSERIQLYLRSDELGESYEGLKKWDIGDIIGIEGVVFKTRRGEVSVRPSSVTLLAKSLRPLPEKFHGLKDTDLRYRQRYLDLTMNPEVRETFVKRTQIIREIRAFLDNRGFLEVETPILQTIVGGAAARPFMTYHNTLEMDLNLRISPELNLKRLIIGGFDKVYEIGRSFRNEGISVRHNPEFTMLELYQAYTDYHGMMDITEDLLRHTTEKVLGTTQITYDGEDVDFGVPFARMTMQQAVKKYAEVDFNEVETLEQARALAKERELYIEDHFGIGAILNVFFEEYCEEKLKNPTFITDYPVEISPLAKRKPSDPDLTERFELFILGREYANAYSELNDPIDQNSRFEHQLELKEAGDEEANDMDEDFVRAMEHGMPPTGGMGLGIDRFVMLLTDSYSIRDVLLFPTMRPL